MNSDGSRRESKGRINRGEQVGKIDATDAEILHGKIHCACNLLCR